MVYKYENAHDWLAREGDHDDYVQLVRKYIDADQIQDLFQAAMDADDYFLDLPACEDCGETEFDRPERTSCYVCHQLFCDDCLTDSIDGAHIVCWNCKENQDEEEMDEDEDEEEEDE
jgi:hypothetical protein